MGVCCRIKFVLKYLLAFTVCIISGITFSISLIPVFALRFFVQILARIFRPELATILKPPNALLANDSLTTHPVFNIDVFLITDNDLDAETAREKIQERIFALASKGSGTEFEYELLRQSVTSFCGYWFWKKLANFDLKDHVREYQETISEADPNLSLPLREEYGVEDLKVIASYLTTKPWRKNHGLWEIILLRNYRASPDSSKRQTVYIIHVHHSLSDGYSIINFIGRICAFQGNFAARPNFDKQKSFTLRALLPIYIYVKGFFDLVLHLASRKFDSNKWVNHPKNRATTVFQTTWTQQPIHVDLIKNLKRKFGVSFLAVVQGISAGAFRKMMIETGTENPPNVTCFIPFPLPNHRGGLRIHASTAMLKVHSGEEDAVKRVLLAHRTVQRESRSFGPLLFLKALKLGGLLPHVFSYRFILPGVTLGMTPFPGMDSPVCFTPNHPCSESFFVTGLPPVVAAGGNITTLSHCGHIIFTFSCRDNICKSMEQLDKFQTFVQEEIQLLEAATGFLNVRTVMALKCDNDSNLHLQLQHQHGFHHSLFTTLSIPIASSVE